MSLKQSSILNVRSSLKAAFVLLMFTSITGQLAAQTVETGFLNHWVSIDEMIDWLFSQKKQ